MWFIRTLSFLQQQNPNFFYEEYVSLLSCVCSDNRIHLSLYALIFSHLWIRYHRESRRQLLAARSAKKRFVMPLHFVIYIDADEPVSEKRKYIHYRDILKMAMYGRKCYTCRPIHTVVPNKPKIRSLCRAKSFIWVRIYVVNILQFDCINEERYRPNIHL